MHKVEQKTQNRRLLFILLGVMMLLYALSVIIILVRN